MRCPPSCGLVICESADPRSASPHGPDGSTYKASLAPARDMYGGEHWQVASTLLTVSGRQGSLWVCSAGYGLIDAHTSIRPYAATFAAGAADSVGGSRSEVQDWWQRLMAWPGLTPNQPRSFADLARSDSQATIVAVLSEAYLRACANDLRDAAGQLANDESFAIIGPPCRDVNLDDLVISVTAPFRPVVGGSLQALNARAAAYVLAANSASGSRLYRAQLRCLIDRATRDAPPDPNRRRGGQRLTDCEVRNFILDHVDAEPTSATRLLRLLRQSGRSCEQSRFKQLFDALAIEGTQ
jgi:hypothetical protein